MTVNYDKYYQTQDLFGQPYPELIAFFKKFPKKEKVLDIGCGQGRDAIPLARMGFEVVGIDHSKVGIAQMNEVAKKEGLNLKGKVEDVYTFEAFEGFDFILLDSMFHFEKKDRTKETALVQSICSTIRPETVVVVCIQDTGQKVDILNRILESNTHLKRIADETLTYVFEDKESGHRSETPYRLIAVKKMDD